MTVRPYVRRVTLFAVVALAVAGGLANLSASDHVDTAEVELSPRLDLNDVYAFPGSTDGRIVLVMNVASPISRLGATGARFDPNALYQFKVDNTGDGVEDRVIQVLFDDMTNGTQRVNVLGPAAPTDTGMINRVIPAAGAVLQGDLNSAFGTATAMQVFAGPRQDPFYLDFEQFVRILPDRRPATFLTNPPPATRFRGPAPTFTGEAPVNFFAGANTLSIVIELPESSLGVGAGADAKIGLWATIGR